MHVGDIFRNAPCRLLSPWFGAGDFLRSVPSPGPVNLESGRSISASICRQLAEQFWHGAYRSIPRTCFRKKAGAIHEWAVRTIPVRMF